MIINEKLRKELIMLEKNINAIMYNHSLTDLQIENFLRIMEKARYNILAEIKLYNRDVEFEYEKIKTIDNDYKAELLDNVLKVYVPEVMSSYKNIKTHTQKRILLNVAECTKQYANIFENEIFIYIKIFDNIEGWDVDNKYIKPIADGLILSNVIKDDNITKMFYCVKGEYSDVPHTEIYVTDGKKIDNYLKNCCTKKYSKLQ